MDDLNEWSTEYNVKVGSINDLPESPHSWDKKVLNITPVKNGRNYRFRVGLQMYRMKTNEQYSLIVELYNRDYITWERQQTYVNGTGMWVESNNTTKYQYHYGSNNTLYYSKTLIRFKKTSSSPPVFVYFTIHYDDKGGELNTYPKEFKNQIYLVAYGVEGLPDRVDSEVYDAHHIIYVIYPSNKMKKDIFEFNHIDNLLSEDEIKTIKEFHEYYHKKFWCFKKTYKHFKILDESINISGILLMIIGTISGGLTMNPIILGVINGVGIFLTNVGKMKNYKKKIEMTNIAFTTYEKVLVELRFAMRGDEFNKDLFIDKMKVIDEMIIDQTPLADKFKKNI